MRAPQSQPAVIRGCQGTTGGQTYSRRQRSGIKGHPASMETPGPAGSHARRMAGRETQGAGQVGKNPQETRIRSLKWASALFHTTVLAVWKTFF